MSAAPVDGQPLYQCINEVQRKHTHNSYNIFIDHSGNSLFEESVVKVQGGERGIKRVSVAGC